MGLAVLAYHTLRPDQGQRVVVDVRLGVDLRHAYYDVAAIPSRQFPESLSGGAGDGLDVGGDLSAVEEAISGCGHFDEYDELGVVPRCLFHHLQLLQQISLLFEEGGGVLDGGGFVDRGLGEGWLIRHGDAPSDQRMGEAAMP